MSTNNIDSNNVTQKVTPFLWFNDNAEEAVNFYTSVFKNSKINQLVRYGNEGAKTTGQNEGSVMTASFELNGQKFIALNGGPLYKFSEAISFVVNCEDQEEVDYFWNALSEGGEESKCGWLKDKFGLSWQIVPSTLPKLLGGPDVAKNKRAMHAMLQMKKLDIATLEQA